jgi:HEAT repeat protein
MTIHAASLLLCVSLLSQATEGKLPQALKAIHSKNDYYVYGAVEIIVAEDKQAVSTLLKALPDCPTDLQPLIIGGLAQLGPRAKPAVGVLHELMNSKDRRVRLAATYALGKIDSLQYTPEIVAIYDRETDGDVRKSLLNVMSPTSPEVKRIMEAELNKDRPPIEAVRLANRIGPEAKNSLPKIMEITQRKSFWTDMRVEAIKAIGAIDPHSPTPFETLEKLANHEDPSLQSTALETLALSQHPRAVEIIKLHLTDEFSTIRKSAVWSLGKRKEASAASELHRMLVEDADLEVRFEIIWALWKIEDNGNEAAQRNLEVMREAQRENQKDEHAYEARQVLESAAQLAGELGPTAGNSVPLLRVLLGDQRPYIRRASIQSLQAIGEPAFPAIPNLKYVARFDSDPQIRHAAEECIKTLEQQQNVLESVK